MLQHAEDEVRFFNDANGDGVAGGIAFVQEGEIRGEFFDSFQGRYQRAVRGSGHPCEGTRLSRLLSVRL